LKRKKLIAKKKAEKRGPYSLVHCASRSIPERGCVGGFIIAQDFLAQKIITAITA